MLVPKFIDIEVNECSGESTGCGANAKCIRNQEPYFCQCSSGYTGDGQVCTSKVCISMHRYGYYCD